MPKCVAKRVVNGMPTNKYGTILQLYCHIASDNNMKPFRIINCCLLAISPVCLLLGCATSRPDSDSTLKTQSGVATVRTNAAVVSLKQDQSGAERSFSNANVVMWVPSNAVRVWDGPTSGVYIGETTPSGAFVKEYRIELDIEIVDMPELLQKMERWSSSNWFYQDHPEVAIIDVQYGKQLRRDIWNHERTKRLLIGARVTKSTTFEEDIEIAMKMVESIKPISK